MNAFNGIQKQDMAQTNDAIYISNDWWRACYYWKHKIIRSKICARNKHKIAPFALKVTTLFYSSAHKPMLIVPTSKEPRQIWQYPKGINLDDTFRYQKYDETRSNYLEQFPAAGARRA